MVGLVPLGEQQVNAMKTVLSVAALAACVVAAAAAAPRQGADLVAALRRGGLILVMRHASSPNAIPPPGVANADNTGPERQLDDAGRTSAVAMGAALRTLRIPIGEVLTSPTYRARETARLAGLPNPKPVEQLGDGGQSMQAVADSQAAWLRERVTHFPTSGNVVIVTHMPNIARAFPGWGAVADGEAVLLGPDGQGGVTVVGRITIDAWPRLPSP
jgi:phosphohistidine phosphatase SixA